MKRFKRRTIRRIALALAVAAVVPATAQARQLDVSGTDLRAAHAEALARSQSDDARTEIPYLSHGVGFSAVDVARSDSELGPGEIPTIVPAKRTRPAIETTPVKADDGFSIDLGTGTISGLVLLLAGLGAGIAIRHHRKTKLSPA